MTDHKNTEGSDSSPTELDHAIAGWRSLTDAERGRLGRILAAGMKCKPNVPRASCNDCKVVDAIMALAVAAYPEQPL